MKDFDTWNEEKKKIELNRKNKFYHPQDIWWCILGLNIGSEQDGKDRYFERPVLIVSALGTQCAIVPLTTSFKKHKYRIDIGLVDGKSATALISQIRVIDTKRLTNKIGFLEKDTFSEIRKAVRKLF